MSYDAYKQTQTGNETPRQTEYRLFTEVTRALNSAKDLPTTDQQLLKALDWNRRIWSALSTDCSVQGNQLPNELRAGIISLSIWVSKHSSKVIRGEENVDELISINRTIMEGLSQQANLPQNKNATSGQPVATNI